MKGWIKTTLGALVQDGSASYQTGPFGTALKASEYSPDGVPLISVGEIREGYLQIHSTTPRVNKVVLDRLPKYILRKDDIVFGRKGAIDRNAIINEYQDGWFLGSDGIRLRLSGDHNSLYFSYLLRSRSIGQWLMQNSQGAIMPTLNQSILDRLPVSIPDLKTQKKIAAVLSALDAKIAINQRINLELEGMAKLLYDYWFVQYDFPLSAAQAAALGKPRLAGQPYRTSGGKMVFNPTLKREIPLGWEVKPIESILAKEGPSKKIPASEILKSGPIPVIDQSKDFICGFTHDEDALIHGSPKIIFGDHTRILKFINFDFARGADGTQIIVSNSESLPPHLFYHSLLKIDLSSYGYARHFKFLKQSNITLPNSNIAQKFEEIVAVHYELIRANTFQNQELTALRDWLLPMLMNGQVRVGCSESADSRQKGGAK